MHIREGTTLYHKRKGRTIRRTGNIQTHLCKMIFSHENAGELLCVLFVCHLAKGVASEPVEGYSVKCLVECSVPDQNMDPVYGRLGLLPK
jgi:hypothetical protein